MKVCENRRILSYDLAVDQERRRFVISIHRALGRRFWLILGDVDNLTFNSRVPFLQGR